MFKSYNSFDRVFTHLTSDWKCIVLDQTQPSPSIENSVYWYKADLEAASFRLCKPIFWRLAANPPRPKASVLVVDEGGTRADKRSMVVVG